MTQCTCFCRRSMLCHGFHMGCSLDRRFLPSFLPSLISRHSYFCLRFTSLVAFSCLQLWDTWGVSENNYCDHELELMMKGRLPSGWTMTSSLLDHEHALRANKGTSALRRIHAVLFFIPVAKLPIPTVQARVKVRLSSPYNSRCSFVVFLSFRYTFARRDIFRFC